jgi:hypothetical protein
MKGVNGLTIRPHMRITHWGDLGDEWVESRHSRYEHHGLYEAQKKKHLLIGVFLLFLAGIGIGIWITQCFE